MASRPALLICTLALAVSSAIALSGCQANPTEPRHGNNTPGPVSSGGTSAGHSDTACISNKNWSADLDELESQMRSALESKGAQVNSVDITGSIIYYFNEAGTLGARTDLTIDISESLHDVDLVTHMIESGPMTAEWYWQGDTNVIVAQDWTSNVQAQGTQSLGGVSNEITIPMQLGLSSNSTLTVNCQGDHLTLAASGSPFIYDFVVTAAAPDE
ncbi:MAG: hypothetical protein KF844_05820 [Cryobacterium sp.]|nr:hypothetical protein [Cryobacterium sp.]